MNLILSNVDDISKKEIQQIATDNVNEFLDNGMGDPLDAYIKAKKQIEYLTTVTEKLKDTASIQGLKYNKQIFHGAKIEMRNTGDKLDYSSDPVYAELEAKLKARKELLTFSYSAYGATIFDEEGVEVMKVAVKTNGVESLFVSF